MAKASKPNPTETRVVNVGLAIYRELKAYASNRGMFMRKVLEFAIVEYMKAHPLPSAKETENANPSNRSMVSQS